jgi:hypothetical protein
MYSRTYPPDGDRAGGHRTSGERLANQLRRLLRRRRFGPLVLWLTDGRRVDVSSLDDIHVNRASGTIEVTMCGDVSEILSEELLAIELRPRSPILGSLKHAGPTA